MRRTNREENRQLNRREVTELGVGAMLASLATPNLLQAADIDTSLPKPPRMPNDYRTGDLRDLNGYFPFTPPETLDDWKQRATALREHLMITCGLWPEPARPDIDAIVHGDVERDGITISRVYFESSPGLYVTGSLFRPSDDSTRRRPTILCPHGHWANGRFYDAGDAEVSRQLGNGAEQYKTSGRFPLQVRCMHLARMGCNVFHYDMIGYADSAPLTYDVAHRFAKQRPNLSGPDQFGMFSAASELNLINVLGLQTWNSLRAVDWLLSREDVDPERIGVTGASGGGTQTFMLAAIDERIAAAFPAVMVSTAMQGGCTCENASLFRTRTGNIEIAALTAPRPLGLTAANDWTVELETKGLPELRQLYEMYGKSDNLTGKYYAFRHNYNAVSRAMMYRFFNRHFDLGQENFDEVDFEPLSRDELTVWGDQHAKPACDEPAEVGLLTSWKKASDEQIAKLIPTDRKSAVEYSRVIGRALQAIVGTTPSPNGLSLDVVQLLKTDGATRTTGWLSAPEEGTEIPLLMWSPADPSGRNVVWATKNGKDSLCDAQGKPAAHVAKLLNAGMSVIGVDTLHTGWFLEQGEQPPSQTRRVNNPREFAGYTLGYNDPLICQRIQDILLALAFAQSAGKHVAVVGNEGAGVWAACAAALNPETAAALIDTEGFRFRSVQDVRHPELMPGIVKYGDVPGILSLIAPRRLTIAGENGKIPSNVQANYASRDVSSHLVSTEIPDDQVANEFAEWLISELW